MQLVGQFHKYTLQTLKNLSSYIKIFYVTDSLMVIVFAVSTAWKSVYSRDYTRTGFSNLML